MNSEAGTDDSGNKYLNIQDMWNIEANTITIQQWYNKADAYWKKVEPTINGVLGGLDFLHKLDIDESDRLVNKLFKRPNNLRALDCGAGIGRITKDLLLKWFKVVDVMDQCPQYIDKAKEELGNKVDNYYTVGLQDFVFQHKYDCIWIQWVASHLTDEHLIKFLKDSKLHLNENGYIIMKENINKEGFIVDKEDYSVIRSDLMFRQLIELSGLKLVDVVPQPNFPTYLYKVNQYIIQ